MTGFWKNATEKILKNGIRKGRVRKINRQTHRISRQRDTIDMNRTLQTDKFRKAGRQI